VAEWCFSRDGVTLLAALAGLAAGFLIVKWVASARARHGTAGYRIVRRAGPVEPHCQ